MVASLVVQMVEKMAALMVELTVGKSVASKAVQLVVWWVGHMAFGWDVQ